MAISTQDIKTLREETGAGMLDCKQALEEAGGDFERAKAALREKGFREAAKRAERATAEGIVEAYLHHNKRLGALVELNCETDFVARTEAFKTLAQQLALQVAGAGPLYVSKEDMPEGAEGDPKVVCLMEQPFLQDESRTVRDLVSEVASKTGENVRVRRFARFDLGQ